MCPQMNIRVDEVCEESKKPVNSNAVYSLVPTLAAAQWSDCLSQGSLLASIVGGATLVPRCCFVPGQALLRSPSHQVRKVNDP